MHRSQRQEHGTLHLVPFCATAWCFGDLYADGTPSQDELHQLAH
jgi:hypothetical protein